MDEFFLNQSWRFLVATNAETLGKVREALSAGNYWIKKAPTS
jgi:nitroreductase